MDSEQRDSPPLPPGLAAALDRIWQRHLPEIEERLAIIESAAAATAAGKLTAEQRQAAQAAAHKLAGVLGSFGLAEGTAPARETELHYAAGSAANPENGPDLAGMATALRSLVESRGRPRNPAK